MNLKLIFLVASFTLMGMSIGIKASDEIGLFMKGPVNINDYIIDQCFEESVYDPETMVPANASVTIKCSAKRKGI